MWLHRCHLSLSAGMSRYPAPYPMIRPGFVPRPMPPPGVVPIQRPTIISGIRAIPPLVAPTARPPAPAVKLADKPPTAVYVGKIAPTVDSDFLLSLLRLCGSVKSWKRAQDPSNGKPKGFGFCEFESAEGILRATRLLNKLSIDGQELVININDATKEYLKKHVEGKKRAQEKEKETEDASGDGTTAVAENESSKPVPDELDETGDAGDKYREDNTDKFGIVTDEDSQTDKDVAEKISNMIEEWLKTRPPPPPSPVQPSADSSGVDKAKNDSDDKNAADADKRAANETERSETASPDKRKDREHDKDKRDKDLERHDRERERVRRDREKDHKHREADRLYRDRLKEWESREREREYQRYSEKEKERDRDHNRRREILKQEDESDDEDNRKRKRRSISSLEDRKRRRQREKEEDLADKIREEEEIAEARRLAVELQRQADEAAAAAAAAAEESASLMEIDGDDEKETDAQNKSAVVEADNISSFANGVGAGRLSKGNNGEETCMTPGQTADTKQNNNVPAKKLGFGLIGLGKRTSVPSVFAVEDDENNVDKSIRPLVPIDYSTEELQAVHANSSTGANVTAAAEFAKRISVSNSKEEKAEAEKDRNRRSSEARPNDERREKLHDREKDKPKSENKKILDAKQLIDMIPRTKEELFAYDINWAIYDKHELQERMRPWISKKIIEFLGEEESTLVDYIVSCTKDHVQAEKMLDLLQSIFDVEAEMFVLKMWRMLIFEIKKVESGLSGRAKS
ncbi:RNA-binding protein 25 isoform X2 [Zea mays]|nr:RNA-binding protein 25 isoform X2 [Zea mays]XP_008664706.1 RNA-binding protein 25 isoform X2 [Zea mays]XP_008664707.1 RNA-binding protein 25 isoform X2 [Zea mays]XP_035820137.1 RNA-binding protein 25 isoform X2 [Zea mays]XP_035820138.1 RNA-binding protein 25 isoform X2 [Zea mays]ONM04831.1 splicing factor PWI domain-containing protein / RNA recognition motif (RRM)-containing protein [Zea mays]ONM04833.1 splicing factor PWI domain-containing protein / RNA recognition motif (RRM)-containing |eukprot:XP_008664702.1 RNA-binding protein 25 isoform X2 [Zea mays]